MSITDHITKQDKDKKETMHPNGRRFDPLYNANPNKKAAAKLAKRVEDYNRMISGSRGNTGGYTCPGSMKI